jgi:arylsulfatase A-like enzyme
LGTGEQHAFKPVLYTDNLRIGVKPGVAYGQSDELAFKTADNPAYSYDFHATILHLLGIDHTKRTWRQNDVDRRLTDVHGHVVKEVLA